MMKQFKTLLLMMFMALTVMTWANWNPVIASGNLDDIAVEKNMDQVEEVIEEVGTVEEDELLEEDEVAEEEEAVEEAWNDQEAPEIEIQDTSPVTTEPLKKR